MIDTPKYILIASTGKNDLKFWLKGTHYKYGEKLALAEIQDSKSYKCAKEENNKKTISIREIHQKLLDETIPYKFSSNPEPSLDCRIDPATDILFDADLQAHIYSSDKYEGLATVQKNDSYLLYAAKLDGLIKTLKKLAGEQKIQLVGGLLLGTDRPEEPGEPIASHRLLAKYFAEQLSLNFAGELPEKNNLSKTPCPVYWLNQLKELTEKGNNRYEGDGLDYPVKRIVTKRIDDAVQHFLSLFTDDTELILSHTGGMADLKALLTSSARFRHSGTILESHQTERSEKFNEQSFEQLILDQNLISRKESLDIRNLVESRIIEGDFTGAWSACAHLHNKNQTIQHDIWTHAVLAVKSYFAGSDTATLPKATYSEELQTALADLQQQLTVLTAKQTHLEQAQSTLTRTFFAIEASLQSTKPQEIQIKLATGLTASLNDQLLRACIFKYLETYREEFQSIKQNLNFEDDEVLSETWDQCRDDPRFTYDKNKKCCTKNLNTFYGRDQWRKTLDNEEELKISKIYNNRMKLIAKNTSKSLQQWRNVIAHGLSLKESDETEILQSACAQSKKQKSLWNPKIIEFKKQSIDSLPIGRFFLNQHSVHQIEKSMGYGIGSTQEKYIKLQETLLKIIRSSIYIPEEPVG